jgi:pentatricopeptide repeat protein
MRTLRFRRKDSTVVSLAFAFLLLVQNRRCCTSFTFSSLDGGRISLRSSSSVVSTRLNVLTEPPRSGAGLDEEFKGPRSTRKSPNGIPKAYQVNNSHRNGSGSRNSSSPRKYQRNSERNGSAEQNNSKWQNAVRVERMLHEALESIQTHGPTSSVALSSLPSSDNARAIEDECGGFFPAFPGIRECNAALAAFGDSGDLLRSLRLYFKMRKASSLILKKRQSSPSGTSPRMKGDVPTPTLVTYSTLMSRAISLGKPKVALRVWKIMTRQPEFFICSMQQLQEQRFRRDVIVPDVKSANILMNCYSKLGDVESAEDLMHQMLSTHGGPDVPSLSPNLVTFNTLLDACHKAGELDKALYWKGRLDDASRGNRFLIPDARTYTSLIATVARKAGQTSSGANDPSLAFRLLKEMKQKHRIQPNGMTYSALIDVCGRCKRSDLALQGLRLMLDDQKQQQQQQGNNDLRNKGIRPDPSLVGAWTSTINACGKAGRIDTAMKLFFESMPRFGVKPNTITCGCLTDSLLRHDRASETLEVLQYMKVNDIALNEVMYTSLMTYASRLAGKEQSAESSQSSKDQMAVQIYSELMSTVLQNKGKSAPTGFRKAKDSPLNEQLYQVSLVFQEMKAKGVQPDLATYNVLLRSIANVGDVNRALEVLKKIEEDEDLEPNSRTWKEVLRAAGKARRSDVVLQTWNSIIAMYDCEVEATHSRPDKSTRSLRTHKKLKSDVLQTFLKSLLICAWDVRESDKHASFHLYKLIIKSYNAILSESKFLGMQLFDADDVVNNAFIMSSIVQAVVNLESLLRSYSQEDEEPTRRLLECTQLRRLGISLSMESVLSAGNLPDPLQKDQHFGRALRTCNGWRVDMDS